MKGHAGFRLNALVSLLANASWAKLAAEFLAAKDDPAELQVFVNTVLAQGWREAGAEIDERRLQARAEPFGLDNIPADVLVLTAGVDVQDDRLEITISGWTRTAECLVLGHIVIWGASNDDTTWQELDELLRTRWSHPLGGKLKLDAVAIDSGDAYRHRLWFLLPACRAPRPWRSRASRARGRPSVPTQVENEGRRAALDLSASTRSNRQSSTSWRAARASGSATHLSRSITSNLRASGGLSATRGASRCGGSSASRARRPRRSTRWCMRPPRGPPPRSSLTSARMNWRMPVPPPPPPSVIRSQWMTAKLVYTLTQARGLRPTM